MNKKEMNEIMNVNWNKMALLTQKNSKSEKESKELTLRINLVNAFGGAKLKKEMGRICRIALKMEEKKNGSS